MESIRAFALAVFSFLSMTGVSVAAESGTSVDETPAPEASTPDDQTGEQRQWTVEQLFDHVIELAQQRASQPHQPAEGTIPEPLANMDYSQYRQIRFRPDMALWHEEALFEVQMFHPGFLYTQPVRLHVLEDGQVEELQFDREMFRYDDRAADLAESAEGNIGFAGFRLHYPLNTEEYKDEVMVFLGASYFRLVGREQVYGLSSRGLAIDTATPSGEEFPEFRDFWLVRPDPESTRMTVFALLDSPSVTGAYRFDISPRANTVVDVDSRLFARRDVRKLGIAPLTSMYFFGESSVRHYDDFRPQVHDSEGLLNQTFAGDWIWRPLSNPKQLHVSSLRDRAPQGFGLVQRDRTFDSYLDTEAKYHRRPSQWVSFGGGDWGSGGVELVEIPTDSEINDNIAAYWVPDVPFRAGEARRFQYRLSTFDSNLDRQDVARVVRTRSGWGAIPGSANPPPRSLRRFIVEFRGGELDTLKGEAPVIPTLEVSAGEIDDLQVRQLPDGRTWRASFTLAPDGQQPADMRLHLSLRERPLTEIWSYVWYPNEL